MSTTLAEVEPPIGAARNWTDELKKLRGDYRLFSTNRCAVCGGPLFEDHEDEATDKDKKKKSKKDKKSEKKKSKKKNEDDEDEEDDEDREKTPKKKKKGVLRFLHRGKDKAGGVLDGLQYEGDELQRKKAKRQRKREEREGRTSSSSLSSSSSSSSTKSGLERVVSESRLSADRRGRAQPSRSKSMRGDLSSARVICRPCERGEKRRSWGTLCEDALERAGPTWRLYEELSDERDLIASLLTRMDYLVGSVSDAGDLLIELFTPQLRADTEREQQLSDAKAAADGGANDNDGEDDDEGPREGTHMKKKKPMRKSNGGASSTTTTTTAATQPSGRPKSGDSKGLALGLARIFGWTTTSSAEGEGKSKVSEDKKQRKVMALLPSCYCPIPKEDKYESYFPAFHLEVYRAAEELQKELTLTADTYKAALKLFARLKATTQTDRQERVVSNMKIAFVEFIQESQPDINWLRVKLQSMFVCQASYVFLVLCQLLWEIRKRQSLWMKLAKPCLATIQVMQGELSSLVVAFHRDWDQHRQRIEEIITEYNKLKAEKAINGGNNGGKASTPRLKGGAEAAADESAKLDDETLLLNCERIVRECVKQVEFNLGEIGLRATKDALIELVANLVLERAKCHL